MDADVRGVNHRTVGDLRSVMAAASIAATLSSLSSPSAFWAGANLPWGNFGYDIGGGAWNASFFDESFATLSASGANAVRFWLHADGRASPTFSSDGKVTGMGGASFESDLKALVGLAKTHELVLELCLWSFDMCKQDNPGETMHDDLISDVTKTQSYIDNALTPMLKILSGSDHVVIEVINEPEWCMADSCNTKDCVKASEMQRFAAMIAEAVHTSTSLRVTVGSASLKWSTALPGGGQAMYWNDTALRSAHASTLGVLDFYNVHYYDWMYSPSYGYDMCRVPLSHWGVDKPTVVAELPATSSHYTAAQMLNCSLEHGFAGDLFWALNDPAFPLAPALTALKAFVAAHPKETTFAALVAWLKALPKPSAMDEEEGTEGSAAAAAEAVVETRMRGAVAAGKMENHVLLAPQASHDDGLVHSRKDFSRESFLRLLQPSA